MLSPNVLQELRRLIQFMSPEDRERMARDLRHRAEISTPTTIKSVLNEIIKNKSPEEQRQIRMDVLRLIRSENERERDTVDTLTNMNPSGGRTRRKRKRDKRTKRTLKR